MDIEKPGQNAVSTIGYARGISFPIFIVKVSGIWIETSTAAAYGEMSERAKEDGVSLVLSSGWRSMEEQRALWLERQDPKVRAVKGIAARPGWSNHQSGRSLDIRTGLTVAQFLDGKTSPVYRWLDANAKKYGFKRDVPSEPWHWTQTGAKEKRT